MTLTITTANGSYTFPKLTQQTCNRLISTFSDYINKTEFHTSTVDHVVLRVEP